MQGREGPGHAWLLPGAAWRCFTSWGSPEPVSILRSSSSPMPGVGSPALEQHQRPRAHSATKKDSQGSLGGYPAPGPEVRQSGVLAKTRPFLERTIAQEQTGGGDRDSRTRRFCCRIIPESFYAHIYRSQRGFNAASFQRCGYTARCVLLSLTNSVASPTSRVGTVPTADLLKMAVGGGPSRGSRTSPRWRRPRPGAPGVAGSAR